VVAVILAAACSTSGASDSVTLPSAAGARAIALSSPSFADGSMIPPRYTCNGRGLSPLLQWSDPKKPAEYVLFLTDPDAQGGTFVHWVMYGIPPQTQDLGEGQGPPGARQGVNGFGGMGYGPPCPPAGDKPHHYVFTLFGLSSVRTNSLESGATAQEVLKQISCCIESEGTLTGTYKR
jgi:Raf kinase inhibitor-like YbhB/YbcL family protein